MAIRNFLSLLRDRWLSIVLLVLLCLGAATFITVTSSKRYASDVQMFVAYNGNSDSTTQYQAAAFTQAQVQTFASIVASPDVLHMVQKDLHLQLSDSVLKAKISATAPTTESIVDLHVEDSTPERAASIANSAARAFISTVEGYYASPTKSDGPSLRLFVTSPGTAPSSAISPKPLLNISLGLLFGLLIGVVFAFVRDAVDNRLKDAESVGAMLDTPVLGVVVEDSRTQRHAIAARSGSQSSRAENFRQLRANLQFVNVDEHPRVLAVTSSIPAEGKTTVAINLASTLAEAGFTVCLIDADLRRPSVARALGLPNSVGLTSVLIQQIDLADALQPAGVNLSVLASGPTPPNPSEVLASASVRFTVRSLLERFDYVILDTAPLLPVADASEVAALADGVLLIGRYKFTTDSQIRRAKQTLRRVDARVIGFVLNRVPAKRNDYGYGYSYTSARPETDGSPARRTSSTRRASPRPERIEPAASDTSGSDRGIHLNERSQNLADQR